MVRRRALVVGLAGFLGASACAAPSSSPPAAAPTPVVPPAPTAAPAAQPLAPTPPPTSRPTQAPAPTPTVRAPEPTPTVVEPKQVALDVRLWNGMAEVQLDGRTIQPGRVMVPPGQHQLAALVDGEVAALADADPDGGIIDLIVPPPQASLAIMVENQADARPQTGLTQADVVYEALAEGGITRFIALFLSGDAPIVGPVRSLRHYFALMAVDYGADVVHIGASPEGFAWRDALNMGHLDESAGDPGVWRVRSRAAPHNAYTDTAADRGFLVDRGRQRNHRWGPLRFSAQAPRGEESAESISLSFRPWSYRVGYTWDAGQERYLRFMEGGAHRDAGSGEQIAPATVIVQFANVGAIAGDEKNRLDVDLIGGSGELAVFSGGTRREGTWTKDAPRSSTRWLDDHGEPLVIPPGQVWVEIVPRDSPLTSG